MIASILYKFYYYLVIFMIIALLFFFVSPISSKCNIYTTHFQTKEQNHFFYFIVFFKKLNSNHKMTLYIALIEIKGNTFSTNIIRHCKFKVKYFYKSLITIESYFFFIVRWWERKCSVLNLIGLENLDLSSFIYHILPKRRLCCYYDYYLVFKKKRTKTNNLFCINCYNLFIILLGIFFFILISYLMHKELLLYFFSFFHFQIYMFEG